MKESNIIKKIFFERILYNMNLFGLIFIAAGALSLLGGICDWEWFMNSRKARFIVTIMSRNGARIFYSIFGFLIMVFGLIVTMGIIDISE